MWERIRGNGILRMLIHTPNYSSYNVLPINKFKDNEKAFLSDGPDDWPHSEWFCPVGMWQ